MFIGHSFNYINTTKQAYVYSHLLMKITVTALPQW